MRPFLSKLGQYSLLLVCAFATVSCATASSKGVPAVKASQGESGLHDELFAIEHRLANFGCSHATPNSAPGRHFAAGIPRPVLGAFCFPSSGASIDIEVYATTADAKKLLSVSRSAGCAGIGPRTTLVRIYDENWTVAPSVDRAGRAPQATIDELHKSLGGTVATVTC